MSYHFLVLAVVAVQRLWELYHSHRLLESARAAGEAEARREAAYPLMVLVHAGWLAGCVAEVVWWRTPFDVAVVLPALAVWGLALVLRAWTLATLDRYWSVRLVERKEQPVITAGPFRHIRHPNYLAVVLEIAAVPLAVGAYRTALAASVANALVLWWRIRAEETHLLEQPAYREAFADKKRFIPGVF